MDVSWPVAGTWAGAACAALALFAWWAVKRDKRRRELMAEYRSRLEDERRAYDAYTDAVRNGAAIDVRRAAAALDAIRKTLDALRSSMPALAALLCAAALAGCTTREGPERVVKLDEHIRVVAPGETVPDYPDGETRWWLLTPAGLLEFVPQYKQAEF